MVRFVKDNFSNEQISALNKVNGHSIASLDSQHEFDLADMCKAFDILKAFDIKQNIVILDCDNSLLYVIRDDQETDFKVVRHRGGFWDTYPATIGVRSDIHKCTEFNLQDPTICLVSDQLRDEHPAVPDNDNNEHVDSDA